MNQNNRKIIGLTGGIASGKSTVSNILKFMGFNVIDADVISREVVEIGKPAYFEIIEHFGRDIIDEDGNINRKKLGSIIFNDDNEREKLNLIVHPYIFAAIKDYIEKDSESKIIFVDIPLLIEVLDDLQFHGIHFDEIWLVYVDEEIQLKRLMERDSIGKEEAIKRIEAQMPMCLKKKYATRIIDNSGEKNELEGKVKKLVEEVI
ncbi:MAG TPA: dephospho-CoA kinase [Tissierellia bacterium]|nr:dephospho-CoA kinase [Tissierellia bacterium]